MISPLAVAWSTVGIGVVLSACVGYGAREKAGLVFVFVSMLIAGCIGVGLILMNGVLYQACAGVKVCAATTDETVWSLAYPILAAPIYWAAMVLSSLAGIVKEKSP